MKKGGAKREKDNAIIVLETLTQQANFILQTAIKQWKNGRMSLEQLNAVLTKKEALIRNFKNDVNEFNALLKGE